MPKTQYGNYTRLIKRPRPDPDLAQPMSERKGGTVLWGLRDGGVNYYAKILEGKLSFQDRGCYTSRKMN